MLDGIYIIRDNGICIASTDNGTVTEKDPHLISPLLDAFVSFTDVNFNGTLKAIVIEDNDGNDKRIYFKQVRIFNHEIKIVAVFTSKQERSWDDFKDINAKLIEFTWLVKQKRWYKYFNSNNIPDRVSLDIEQSVADLFNIQG
ncbi:hypothetical protein GF325_14265 [Candidatus Bathyarchaeota archaeon]|nr:hypothetical protein [Candidatus Bathyarchaeota archaeon]